MYSKTKQSELLKDAAQETDTLRAIGPAFDLAGNDSSPLIFASPHSGNIYPQSWLERCRLPLRQLRQAEDIYVDELFSAAADHGASFIKARFARSFVDANRADSELPADWIDSKTSPRAAAGLGVIPMAIAQDMPIYKRPPTAAMGQARLTALYHPYHNALSELIDAAKAAHGRAVLIDCHSMPGFGPLNRRRADFILGDRFGKSCDPALIDHVGAYLKGHGYSVTRNHPYAGGHVTAHYGRTNERVHVLQIEVNRDLYVSAASLAKKPGFGALQARLSKLILRLSQLYGAPDAQSARLVAE